MANELSDALHELRELREKLRKINIAVCVFAREELGNMNFESDEEAIEYIMSFYEDKK